jgi:hypothetical protein
VKQEEQKEEQSNGGRKTTARDFHFTSGFMVSGFPASQMHPACDPQRRNHKFREPHAGLE